MNASGEPSYRDHERKDVDVGSLFLIVLVLFISCAVILLSVAMIMHRLNLKEPGETAEQSNNPATRAGEFPQPRHEVKPGARLAELRAAEDADLNSYGWVDRTK